MVPVGGCAAGASTGRGEPVRPLRDATRERLYDALSLGPRGAVVVATPVSITLTTATLEPAVAKALIDADGASLRFQPRDYTSALAELLYDRACLGRDGRNARRSARRMGRSQRTLARLGRSRARRPRRRPRRRRAEDRSESTGMNHGETVAIDGISHRWLERGDGPVVVRVHGIPTSPALWRHVTLRECAGRLPPAGAVALIRTRPD